MIVTHPDNKPLLDEVVRLAGVIGFDLSAEYRQPRYLEFMNARRYREAWQPPAENRFVAYGPEDEAWMRPLGIGRLIQVDDGPLIYRVDDRMWPDLSYYGISPIASAAFPMQIRIRDFWFTGAH